MNKSIKSKRILPFILAFVIAISCICFFTSVGVKLASAEETEIVYVAEVPEETGDPNPNPPSNAKDFKLTETLVYALVGFALTLTVLAFLWGFINLLKLIIGKVEKIGDKSTTETATEVNANLPLAPGSSGQVKTYGIPDKDVAMIMAIVADELKTPLNELKFISIKEIKENN